MAFFNILARMMLDTSDVEAGVKRAESSVKGFAGNLGRDLKGAIAGAFTVGAVTSFTKSVIDAADRIGDLAEQFQITNEEVQKLEILASRTGVPLEKMGQALIKLSEVRRKASAGDKDSVGLLGSFGISQDQASNSAVSNLQLLTNISEEYAKQAGSFDSQARAADLLGTKMESVLRAMRGINELGPIDIISDADIKALGEANDAIDELIRQSKVAAAPAVGFWGRVMKRGMALDSEGKSFALTRAIFAEMRDEGQTSSEALPVPDSDSPFFTDFGGAEDFRAGRDRVRAQKKAEREAIARGQNPFMDGGSTARIGGLYFGAGYNQQVLSELKAQVAELRKIANATNVTATTLTKEN
jgi:hypothetical protein